MTDIDILISRLGRKCPTCVTTDVIIFHRTGTIARTNQRILSCYLPIHTNSTNRSFRGLCNVTETFYILFCFYLFDIVFVFEHRKCFYFFSSIRVIIYQFQKFVLSSTKQEFFPFLYVS